MISREFRSGGLAYNYDLVLESTQMQQVHRTLQKVAGSNATILLLGESGTGKEPLAKEIHFLSGRARYGNYVCINCTAVPADLLENELFGHVRGAFTGADRSTVGKFAYAGRGTIVLDEIGDMDYSTQASLLRVLQEKTIMQIGGNREINIRARLVASTNKNLQDAVRDGQFRQDLLYRLNTVTVAIPPLRERVSDIEPLIQYYTAFFCSQYNRKLRFGPDAIEQLSSYPWPGNVRELRHFVDRAVLLERDEITGTPDAAQGTQALRTISAKTLDCLLGIEANPKNRNGAAREIPSLEEMRTRFILERLNLFGGNRVATAKSLGIARSTLYHKLKKCGVSRKDACLAADLELTA